MLEPNATYKLYQDLLIKQKESEFTETFIAKKRALFAQLPPPAYLECQQLEMVYSTLHEKIREKVPRDTVQTFDELLGAAKCAEESKSVKKRIRCNFCRHPGHTADVCRKKADSKDTPVNTGGFLKLGRKTIKFKIDDISDEGIIGSAAESCVASYKLYTKLKARGYQFKQCRDRVTTLGSQVMDFLRVTCNINVEGRIIPTTFVVFPESREPDTYLGLPFLDKIGFIGDVWYFFDDPTKKYLFSREKPRNDNVARVGILRFG